MSYQQIHKELHIPNEHPCFADHFPGNPIVPGALLLQWVFNLINDEFVGVTIQGVRSLKFIEATIPGDLCNLFVESSVEQGKMKIKCLRGDTLILKGDLNIVKVDG